MFFLCIIPARGGSKGVKDKNVLEICGKPLIQYSIESARESELLNNIVVSTDSDKIASVVKQVSDVEVIKRPKEFAKDDSPIEEALIHATQIVEKKLSTVVDFIVWLQPNVPIRKKGLVDDVINELISEKGDSCATCYEIDQIPELMKTIDSNGRIQAIYKNISGIRRQEFEKRYLLDGSVTIMNKRDLWNSQNKRIPHSFLGEQIIPYIQEDKKYSLEIDAIEDVKLLSYFMNN